MGVLTLVLTVCSRVQPLQIRESFPEQAHKLSALGVYAEGLRTPVDELLREAAALDIAR